MHKRGSLMEPDKKEPTITSSSSASNTNITCIVSTYVQNGIFWTYRLGLNFPMFHVHMCILCLMMVHIAKHSHSPHVNLAFCTLRMTLARVSGHSLRYSASSVWGVFICAHVYHPVHSLLFYTYLSQAV